MNQAPRLDTRFLRIHPVTAKWFEQREKCRTCFHHLEASHSAATTRGVTFGERCGASRMLPPGNGNRRHENCIDARATADERDDGRAGICGPDAVLWEPKA